LTFTFQVDKNVAEGTDLKMDATITDNMGSGPFPLTVIGHVIAPREESPENEHPPKPKPDSKVQAGPSRPNVTEVERGLDDSPITIEKEPNTERLKLLVNKGSR